MEELLRRSLEAHRQIRALANGSIAEIERALDEMSINTDPVPDVVRVPGKPDLNDEGHDWLRRARRSGKSAPVAARQLGLHVNSVRKWYDRYRMEEIHDGES